MKEVTFTFRYTGDAETWDEIREDAEQGKIKSVFIGKKEFVNAELIAELEAQLPKEGEWIDGDARKVTARCSVCGHLRLGNGAKWANMYVPFCEICGAKMKGENDEQIH